MSEFLALEQIVDDDPQDVRYLTFSLDSECYGIEIKYVTEIIGIQPITEVPEMPEYIKGIINLRGRIIPIMDVRLRFKKPFREYDERTCIIVIEIRDIVLGLIVDRVSEVLTIPGQNIAPAPDITRAAGSGRFVTGIGRFGEDIKILLDSELFLKDDDIEALENLEES
jgi:purine-binding chemotaxis protein CheW